MPLMTKIRENMTKTFAVFAGVFVVYIVLDWGMDFTGRRHSTRGEAQEVGIINGHHIPLKDFTDLVRQASDNQKQQTGTEPDDNQLVGIREQVWNQLVDETLYGDEAKRLGISVTDQEIIDWVRGDNPPAFLRQQFTDSTGNFNRQAYDNAIQNPQNSQIWIRVEDYLRKERLREKIESIVGSTVRVTDDEVRQRYIDQNIKYDADLAFFDPNAMVKDSEVTVTDDDLRKEYNDNQEEFRQDATRKLKYVSFNIVATKADTDAVVTDMNDVLTHAKEGGDFIDLAKTYSETPINDSTFFKHGELNPDREKQVFDAKAGDIIGPTVEADGYHLVKVLEFKDGTDDFIRASHILIQVENNDSAKALKLAKDVYAKAKGGQDFGELAKQYSKDGSASQGGDLGWFGKGKMVKQFEDAAFKAKTGQIVGPVKTQFGYHIIKVVARDNREVKIADVHIAVHPSSATKENISQQAQDFQYIAKENNDIVKTASQNNYTVAETQPFQKDAFIPNIGLNPAANKFAFTGKLNEVSEVLTVQNGNYAIFMISEIKEAGIRPFDEVKATLEPRVRREKKMEKIKGLVEDLRKQLAPTDSLGKLSILRPGLIVQPLRGFTLSGFLPNVGRDLMLTGAISAMTPGEIANPVEGQRGWYIVKLLSKTPFDENAFNTQKMTLRNQMMSERRNAAISDWSTKLKKVADIIDDRDIWYK